MNFLCLPCLHESRDPICPHCDSEMDEGVLCIGCAEAKATHDDFCLSCVSTQIIEKAVTYDELPKEWHEEIAKEVANLRAAYERVRLERQALARKEFFALIAMVARAPLKEIA